MKKTSKILTCTLVLLTIFIFSFSMGFESSAAVSTTNEFYVKYPEPTCDEFSGYLFVSYWNSATQQNASCCYFWRLTPSWQFAQESGVDISFCMNIELTNDNQFVFSPYCEGTTTQLVQFGFYNADDNYRIKKNSGSTNNSWSFTDDYSQYSINGYIYGGNVGTIKGASAWNNVDTPIVHFSNSVDAIELYYRLQQILDKTSQIEGDTLAILNKAIDIYNQNVATNQKLDNMTVLLEQLTKQTTSDKQSVDEFDSNSTAQSDKINELNKQNTTEKVDVNSASNEVDKHIDTVAIGNYGAVLSVFTGNTHILQYLLIVLVIALISYVLFGKR